MHRAIQRTPPIDSVLAKNLPPEDDAMDTRVSLPMAESAGSDSGTPATVFRGRDSYTGKRLVTGTRSITDNPRGGVGIGGGSSRTEWNHDVRPTFCRD